MIENEVQSAQWIFRIHGGSQLVCRAFLWNSSEASVCVYPLSQSLCYRSLNASCCGRDCCIFWKEKKKVGDWMLPSFVIIFYFACVSQRWPTFSNWKKWICCGAHMSVAGICVPPAFAKVTKARGEWGRAAPCLVKMQAKKKKKLLQKLQPFL